MNALNVLGVSSRLWLVLQIKWFIQQCLKIIMSENFVLLKPKKKRIFICKFLTSLGSANVLIGPEWNVLSLSSSLLLSPFSGVESSFSHDTRHWSANDLCLACGPWKPLKTGLTFTLSCVPYIQWNILAIELRAMSFWLMAALNYKLSNHCPR